MGKICTLFKEALAAFGGDIASAKKLFSKRFDEEDKVMKALKEIGFRRAKRLKYDYFYPSSASEGLPRSFLSFEAVRENLVMNVEKLREELQGKKVAYAPVREGSTLAKVLANNCPRLCPDKKDDVYPYDPLLVFAFDDIEVKAYLIREVANSGDLAWFELTDRETTAVMREIGLIAS